MAIGISNKPSVFFGPPPAKLPFYDGNPWFLPTLNKYYSFKDWLKSYHS